MPGRSRLTSRICDELPIYRCCVVDPTKEPKQIDMTLQFPIKEEKVRMGIYKIENDVLTCCYAKAGAERPANFEPWNRNDVQVITLRRKKDAPEKSKIPQ